MITATRVPSSTLEHPVWVALSTYSIGPEDAQFGFVERLARENGWTDDHAEQVMEEYRRFVFLGVTGNGEVTPSDAVDQAWHLHLTYTRDYWERFCPEVLGRPLHHGPTKGGADERDRFFRQYAETLAAYERAFGETPPEDIWPSAAQRLTEDPKARRIHPRDVVIINRRVARILLFCAVAFATFAFLRWT